MKAYVGETRARKMRALAVNAGFGLVVQRGRVGKARIDLWESYIYDNLAFTDWREGREFDAVAFVCDMILLRALTVPLVADAQGPTPLPEPEFCVLPDRVAGGLASLAMSLAWLAFLEPLGFRWALAVQDGMTPDDIPWDAPFDVIFVGGSPEWKWATAVAWVKAAHNHGKACHIGRVGNKTLVKRAANAGADFVDTAQCLWAEDAAKRYRGAIEMANSQTRWEWT